MQNNSNIKKGKQRVYRDKKVKTYEIQIHKMKIGKVRRSNKKDV